MQEKRYHCGGKPLTYKQLSEILLLRWMPFLIGVPLTEKVLQSPALVQASAVDEGDNLTLKSIENENGRNNPIESKLEKQFQNLLPQEKSETR